MSNKGIPLSRMMKFTALVALNLAIVRSLTFIPQSPPLLFTLVLLDLVLVQALILGRPLRAFHFTFMIVGLGASMALTALAFLPPASGKTGSLRILTTLIRGFEAIGGDFAWTPLSYEYLEIAERCVTSTLGLLIAWAAGLFVASQVRRRASQPGSRIPHVGLFFQGALIGLFAFTPIGLAISSWGEKSGTPQVFIRIVLGSALALFLILGGYAALALNHRRSPDGSALQEASDPSEISASSASVGKSSTR